MLINIARFEFRYLLRNPLVWVTALLTFTIFFLATSLKVFELSSEGGMLENAAVATLKNYVMISVLFMFVTTSFVANAVIRDDETGFGPIIRSRPITKFEYLIGRFLGAFSIAALLMLFVPLGLCVGPLMPWADPTELGPTRLTDHLYGYFLIGLPNILVHSGVLFALATITRSMMAAYLGVLGFMSGFMYLREVFDRPQLETTVAILEPFASRALSDATRYWTLAEKNVLLPELAGALLYNRLLWIAISLVCLAIAWAGYRYADQGMSKRARKNRKLAASSEATPLTRPSATLSPHAGRGATLPSPGHGSAATRALLWMRTKFEARQVITSPAFPMLLAWGLYTTFFVLMTQRDPDGRPSYPTTLSLIPEMESFRGIAMIVAIYYAGELVWRERDRRVHELIDASPIPSWAYVIPKTLAMALVLLAMVVVNVLASVIAQLSLGYTALELGKYLLWYVLPESADMLLLAAVTIVVQSLSPHKAVGWGIMVLFVMWRELNNGAQLIEHNLLNFSGMPWVPFSDLNGAGSFWKGAWTFRLYWGAFTILLLLAAHLLWRRGTDIRLRPRLALARRRLAGPAGRVAVAALLTFAGTGAYAYYNTNVLNHYEGHNAWAEELAEYEKRFWKYRALPQPALADVKLDVALYPEERRAVTKGRYLLRNAGVEPITEVHVRGADRDMELAHVALSGARLVFHDTKHRYRIYRLDRPMQKGAEIVMSFETRRWHRGFRNGWPPTRMVENGTFLSSEEFMPILGVNGAERLQDPALRRKYGLAGEALPPKLEDVAETERSGMGRGWAMSDITVSTSADQTPIAPGKKVSDVTRGDRRIARFISGVPISNLFSIQSARYAEKHRIHNGVDLAVYYHPAHEWNVGRMLDAMAASLSYYQANFGPYQFDHARITEFPGYGYYAQAFAGTIPYSETLSFVSDYRAPETIDHVALVTAHELAHQYWGHQLMPAPVEGSSVLSETLANYSAMMVMRKMNGADEIRRALQYELDRYLNGRAGTPREETPLIRVAGQNHITYSKGALAMYLLQERLGEDTINRALRKLLNRHKFKGPPLPRSIDLVDALRAEANTAEEQAMITDLFERIVLYDLKVLQPAATRRPDGKWNVTVPIEAKKFHVTGKGAESETPLAERIEVGLFTEQPGRDAFDKAHVILMERHPLRSGRQVLKFVSDKKPLYAGVDPYNFYIDRKSEDNVAAVN